MPKLSRSKIAAYFADEIATDQPDVIKRLAALLMDTHRIDELDLIVDDIEYELYQRGIIMADVTTALPVDEGFHEAVRQLLATQKDDKVILREHIDPELIGGIKIRAAGRELDASVRHKLMKLKGAL